MRVAIVHDDLVQWGGAERMLAAICEVFPDAPIYTSLFDRSNKYLLNHFGNKKIVTSFLQKIPGWRNIYKAMLPLYPIAFEQFDFSGFDLVISQTTRFAKAIITKPETRHICYCHTPPRFLWNFSGEVVPGILSILTSKLRIYDAVSANRVDLFLAGSKNAQDRIKKIYRQDSKILYPFVDTERFAKVNRFDGGYFLIIARLNSYKRLDIAVDVFNNGVRKLKIVGVGPKYDDLKKTANLENVEFLVNVSDELLLNLIAGAKALIITSEEDFGLTSLESQAAGRPVIAFSKGGARETILDSKTGILYGSQTVESLAGALARFEKMKFESRDCLKWVSNFSKKSFKDQLNKCIMT